MGRKRRSKRTPATRSFGRPTKRNHDAMQRIPFMDLPPEIRDAVVEHLSIQDLAILVRTSKSIQAYLEPRLYCKTYTKMDTSHNTAGLVELLKRRTHIAPIINTLVLDEYHPRHTRRLVSIQMPNLWCLLVQHKGDSIEYVSEREKRARNRNKVKQPKIGNCLKELFIEQSEYSTAALKRLISPSECLTSIILHHLRGPLPFEEQDLCAVLSHAAATLKLLKLFWTYRPVERDYGFNLSQFTALRPLRIEPGLLLRPHNSLETYTSTESPDLAQLIRSRLPPNLKILLLESLTTSERLEREREREREQVIFRKDLEFMRCLLENRGIIAPKLTCLFMYYLNNMVEPEGFVRDRRTRRGKDVRTLRVA
ncbi:MAG: hypothetical protein Q9208_004731 [Pyrenodesmia sp. 3 TL-2023]